MFTNSQRNRKGFFDLDIGGGLGEEDKKLVGEEEENDQLIHFFSRNHKTPPTTHQFILKQTKQTQKLSDCLGKKRNLIRLP